MEKEDEENRKIHFCLPVCGNDRHYVPVRRLSEIRESKSNKEKTDRTVALLGHSGQPAALGWILAAGHYDGTAAVQSASAIFAIKGLFLYLPLVITVIVLIIWYLFMGIDKIYPTVRKELDECREKAE